MEACTPKVKRLVEKVIEEKEQNLLSVLKTLEQLFPRLKNNLTIRSNLEKLSQLPQNLEPAAVAKLFIELEELFLRLSPSAMSDQ